MDIGVSTTGNEVILTPVRSPEKTSSFDPSNAEPILRRFEALKTRFGDIYDYAAAAVGQMYVPKFGMPIVELGALKLDRYKLKAPLVGPLLGGISVFAFAKEMGAHILWRAGLNFWTFSKQYKGDCDGIKDEPYPYDDAWKYLKEQWNPTSFLLYGGGQAFGQFIVPGYLNRFMKSRGLLQQTITNQNLRGAVWQGGRNYLNLTWGEASSKFAGISIGTYLGWSLFDMGLDNDDSITYPLLHYSPIGDMGSTLMGFTAGGYLGQNVGIMGGDTLVERLKKYVPPQVNEFIAAHTRALPALINEIPLLRNAATTFKSALSAIESGVSEANIFAKLGTIEWAAGRAQDAALFKANADSVGGSLNEGTRFWATQKGREAVKSVQAARAASASIEQLTARAATNASSATAALDQLANATAEMQGPTAIVIRDRLQAAARELAATRSAIQNTTSNLRNAQTVLGSNGPEFAEALSPIAPLIERLRALEQQVSTALEEYGRTQPIRGPFKNLRWTIRAYNQLPLRERFVRTGALVLDSVPGAFKAVVQIVSNIVFGFTFSSVTEYVGRRKLIPATYRLLGDSGVVIQPPKRIKTGVDNVSPAPEQDAKDLMSDFPLIPMD